MSVEIAETPAKVETFDFYLQTDGQRVFVHKFVVLGCEAFGAPIKAAGFVEARRMFEAKSRDLIRIISSVHEGARKLAIVASEAPQPERSPDFAEAFRSTNDALRFAVQYAGQQSPHTPMTQLMQGGSIGSGRGFVGSDGAGQAGMILGAVDRLLSDQQRAVILVRFGAAIHEPCPCCGLMGHPAWWNEAVSTLSLIESLKDLPKPIREDVVKKTVGRKKIRVQNHADGYEVTERQIRRRISAAKDFFGRIENTAMGVLHAHFGV